MREQWEVAYNRGTVKLLMPDLRALRTQTTLSEADEQAVATVERWAVTYALLSEVFPRD